MHERGPEAPYARISNKIKPIEALGVVDLLLHATTSDVLADRGG
jgi:hypothetical protein